MSLSLVSVNIEWDKHLDAVLALLAGVQPDIICLQELLEPDLPRFEEAIGTHALYTPNMLMDTPRGRVSNGQAIISKFPFTNTVVLKYAGSVGSSYVLSKDPATWDKDYELRALSGATVTKDGVAYRVFTTHFNWTQNGESTDLQRAAMVRMLDLLKKEEPCIIAGDFNAPRGRATFEMMAAAYRDNIPPTYESSLDPVLHTKAGRHLPYMVDGLFTSEGYQARDVSLQFGVSDHAAIVATIERA